MEPPAGAAPARLSYKGSLQAAARRRNGLPSRSSKSEGWSQSPVLPWARRAYETRLSAGSTAAPNCKLRINLLSTIMEPPPGVAPGSLPVPRRRIADNALGALNWRP